MLTRREAISGMITASLKYDEAGLFAEHPTDAERIARLADDFAQVWARKAAEARAAVETPDHLGDLGIVNVRTYGAVGDDMLSSRPTVIVWQNKPVSSTCLGKAYRRDCFHAMDYRDNSFVRSTYG